jgi:competence protein ComFC
MLSWLYNFILSLIFPTYCAGCYRLGNFVCGKCYDKIEFHAIPVNLILEPLFLDQVISAARYKNPINSLLYLMKYKNVIGVARFFGQFLFDTTLFPAVDVITSVPLHKQRQRERGFNQAAVIAKEFARLANRPYAEILIKSKKTSTQAKTATKLKRLHNLDNAFFIHPKWKQTAQQLPTSVLIIDDVCTTGTTLNQCAKVLKNAGVKQVFGLVVAHGG